jgi:cytochrome c556
MTARLDTTIRIDDRNHMGSNGMKQWRRVICSLAGAAAMVATVSTAQADDQDTIEYRQSVMKTIGAQAKILGLMAEKKVPTEDFAKQVQVLAVMAATAKSSFEANVPGGKSKPAVWADWADFSKRMDEFSTATAALAKTAQSGGVDAALPALKGAMTCKGCHDTYRSSDK